jgi:hypothetical protein
MPATERKPVIGEYFCPYPESFFEGKAITLPLVCTIYEDLVCILDVLAEIKPGWWRVQTNASGRLYDCCWSESVECWVLYINKEPTNAEEAQHKVSSKELDYPGQAGKRQSS